MSEDAPARSILPPFELSPERIAQTARLLEGDRGAGGAVRVLVDRRIVRTHNERVDSTCDECGAVAEEATVELGQWANDKCPYDYPTLRFCPPCLKRAVTEAEAAIAKDKG